MKMGHKKKKKKKKKKTEVPKKGLGRGVKSELVGVQQTQFFIDGLSFPINSSPKPKAHW